MPAQSSDPAALLAVVRALTGLRERVEEADRDLAATHVDAGERHTSAAVDDAVDQVIDALRALADVAAEQSLALRTVAQAAGETERETERRAGSLRSESLFGDGARS